MNEELKYIQDSLKEVVSTIQDQIDSLDYGGLKESIGDIATLKKIISETNFTGFESGIQKVGKVIEFVSNRINNVLANEEIHLRNVDLLNNVSNDLENKFDSISEKILDVIGKIPLVGNILKESLQNSFDNIKQGLVEGLTAAAATGALTNQNLLKMFTDTFSAIGNMITQTFKTVLLNPTILLIGILAAGVALLVSQFNKFEGAAADFRKEFGLTIDQAKELRGIAERTYINLAAYGVSLEDSYKAAGALTSEFGNTQLVSESLVRGVALLNSRLGVGQDNAAGMLHVLTAIGGATDQSAVNLAGVASQMARAAGVPLDKVAADIAGSSEFIATYFRGAKEQIIEAAIGAARLGTSLSSIEKSVESVLDFQSSIANEMKASALLGQRIGLSRLRQLGYTGDMIGYQKELLNQMNQIGDFNSMDFLQKKAISEALGLSVSEMSNMIMQQEKINSLTTQQKQAYYDAKKQLANINELNGEQILLQAQQEVVAAELMNRLSGIWASLSRLILPVVELIADGLEFVLSIIDSISGSTDQISSSFESVHGRIKGIKEETSGWMTVLKWIGGFLIGGLGLALLLKGFIKIGNSIKGLKSGLTDLFSSTGNKTIIDKIIPPKQSIGRRLANFFKDMRSAVMHGVGIINDLVKSILKVINTAVRGVFEVLQTATKGLVSVFKILGNAFMGPQAGAILVGAAAFIVLMYALAGAFALASLGFEAFGKMMESVGKGIAAIITSLGDAIGNIIDSMTTGLVKIFGAIKDSDPAHIFNLATSIGALGLSLLSLASGTMANTLANVGSGVAEFFGFESSGLLGTLKSLEEINVERIERITSSIRDLSTSLMDISQVPIESLNKVNDILQSVKPNAVETVVSFVKSVVGDEDNNTSINLSRTADQNVKIKNNFQIVLSKEIDRLINTIEGMEVSMNGKKVGKIIATSTSLPATSL